MSDVKRYVTTCDCMSEAAWGDYVLYADAQHLLAQRDAEVSKWKALAESMQSIAEIAQSSHERMERLRALESQQAASVGGEREAFKVAMNAINKTVGQWREGKFANPYAQAAWEGWQARAALSPAGGGERDAEIERLKKPYVQMRAQLEQEWCELQGLRMQQAAISPAGGGVVKLPTRISEESCTTEHELDLCRMWNNALSAVARLNAKQQTAQSECGQSSCPYCNKPQANSQEAE